MTTRVYLSTVGRPEDPERATVTVFDRGFLYGDSVYETLRTVGGRPFVLDRHLQRLERSAAGIGLRLPFDAAAIERALVETHGATGNEESYLRIMVTRGTGPISLDTRLSEDPLLVVIAKELVLPPAERYEKGIRAALIETEKAGGLLDPGVKSGNYLGSILALQAAIERGADDAIMVHRDGRVTEGATSNLFVVDGDGALRTPPLTVGLLAGITRELIMEAAAREGIPVAESDVMREDLLGARELFLTSSVRGIMPVTSLDGQAVGEGLVGLRTRAIRAAYDAFQAQS